MEKRRLNMLAIELEIRLEKFKSLRLKKKSENHLK